MTASDGKEVATLPRQFIQRGIVGAHRIETHISPCHPIHKFLHVVDDHAHGAESILSDRGRDEGLGRRVLIGDDRGHHASLCRLDFAEVGFFEIEDRFSCGVNGVLNGRVMANYGLSQGLEVAQD
jgi:hypothetical protein